MSFKKMRFKMSSIFLGLGLNVLSRHIPIYNKTEQSANRLHMSGGGGGGGGYCMIEG